MDSNLDNTNQYLELDIDFDNSNFETNFAYSADLTFSAQKKILREYLLSQNYDLILNMSEWATCIVNCNMCFVIKAGEFITDDYFIVDTSNGEENAKIYYVGKTWLNKDELKRIK